MPRLVREHGNRPARAAPGHIAVEGQAVEVMADLGSQDREIPVQGRDAVGVLDGTDVVACFVATDRDGLLGDDGRLVRKALDRLGSTLTRYGAPARRAVENPNRADERADHREADRKAAD